MFIFYVCILGRLAKAMMLYASPKIVGTTQPLCTSPSECPVAGDSYLTHLGSGNF